MTKFLQFASVMLLIGFVGISVSAQKTKAVAKGDWGGTGIALNVAGSTSSVQFDCAGGEIAEELRMDKNGTFSAEGTFSRRGPGPIRVGREPQAQKVIYKGKVTGDRMTLGISDAATGDSLGTFTLVRGEPTKIHRCY